MGLALVCVFACGSMALFVFVEHYLPDSLANNAPQTVTLPMSKNPK